MAREAGIHQRLVARFAVFEVSERPAARLRVLFRVLDHKLNVNRRFYKRATKGQREKQKKLTPRFDEVCGNKVERAKTLLHAGQEQQAAEVLRNTMAEGSRVTHQLYSLFN